MLTLYNVRDKKYIVMGLGPSGISVCRALIQSGAHVIAWDDASQSRQYALNQGLPVSDPEQIMWQDATALILAPGIPHHLPQPHVFASKAIAANVPIICDIELLVSNEPQALFVGITGSNGKSTTTALINHVLQSTNRHVQMGGNIGIPVCDLELLDADDIYLLELSSFHLERMPSINLDIAVLTNMTPDHLERHGDMAGYVAAKQLIFQTHGKAQGKKQTAIISIDDEFSTAIYATLQQEQRHHLIPVSTQTHPAGGLSVKNHHLYDDAFSSGQQLFTLLDFPALKGRHNWQNLLCAYATLRTLDVTVEAIYEGFMTFQNLPHRLQSLGFIKHIEFINDSKATNPDSAAYALAACDNIYWIVGGVAKQSELNGLEKHYSKVKQAYVIGDARVRFSQILSPHMPVTLCQSLEDAVNQAYQSACQDKQAVILLSPACASYDQFKNFEERGYKFQQCFKDIKLGDQALDNHLHLKDT